MATALFSYVGVECVAVAAGKVRDPDRNVPRATLYGRLAETPRFVRDLTVATLALVFSILFIFYSRNTGHSFWVYWAPYVLAGAAMLAGIPVYRRARAQMTEPQPVPPYSANPG